MNIYMVSVKSEDESKMEIYYGEADLIGNAIMFAIACAKADGLEYPQVTNVTLLGKKAF